MATPEPTFLNALHQDAALICPVRGWQPLARSPSSMSQPAASPKKSSDDRGPHQCWPPGLAPERRNGRDVRLALGGVLSASNGEVLFRGLRSLELDFAI